MVKLLFELLSLDDPPDDQEQNDSEESAIQKCIEYLIHACQCKDANCIMLNCQKMKKVVHHASRCEQKMTSGCPVCKQLIALCCYHADHCQEAVCPVPFCEKIKLKKEQQLQR